MNIILIIIGFLLGLVFYYFLNKLNPKISIIDTSFYLKNDVLNKKSAKEILKEKPIISRFVIINMTDLNDVSDDFFYYLLRNRYNKFGDNFLDNIIINKNNCKFNYTEKIKNAAKRLEKEFRNN